MHLHGLLDAQHTRVSAHPCAMEREANWIGRLFLTSSHLCFQGKLDKRCAKVTIHWCDVIRIQARKRDDDVIDAIKVNSLTSKVKFDCHLNVWCECLRGVAC
jgi:hypothetical protein